MKFTGLILICAAGSLALILPAAGVVKFPMHKASAPFAAIGNSATAVPASLSGGMSSSGALPPSSNLPDRSQPNGEPSNAAQFAGTLVEMASLVPGTSDSIDPWNKQSLCMGFWLLLGPVALLGLALWTFSPGPKPNSV